MANPTQTPEVLWAQRSSTTEAEKNIIFLSINASDVTSSSAKVDLTPTRVSFKGYSETKKVEYQVDLDLFGEIDVDNSKYHHSARGVEMVLRKKELKEEYWPRLLKESKKVHFLKTDFDKWVDEDEQDEAADEPDMNPGADGGLGGIDFSQLGAMGGGAGGMPGMPDMSALAGMQGMQGGAGEEEGSDDEMPALEGEEEPSKPKIEEVK